MNQPAKRILALILTLTLLFSVSPLGWAEELELKEEISDLSLELNQSSEQDLELATPEAEITEEVLTELDNPINTSSSDLETEVENLSQELDILTVKDLRDFQQAVNAGTDYNGWEINLQADLALEEANSYTSESRWIYEDNDPDSSFKAEYIFYTLKPETNIWTPIGSSEHPFKGSFNGNGYQISGIYTDFALSYQGLFGYLASEAQVSDLTVDGLILGESTVGGIAGYNAGNIENCINKALVSATGSGSGTGYIGGIVGDNLGDITNCWNQGAISGVSINKGGYVGGIVGRMEGGTGLIYQCGNSGAITGWQYIGGIAGAIFEGGTAGEWGSVQACCNLGTVSGKCSKQKTYAGGIVGRGCGDIMDCYNRGYINLPSTNSTKVGGILGDDLSQDSSLVGTVQNCYNTGVVYGAGAGNIVGSGGWAENCYYLQNQIYVGDNAASDYSFTTSKSESEMQEASFVAELGSAFISDSNNSNGGYPILSWQDSSSSQKAAYKNGDSLSNSCFFIALQTASSDEVKYYYYTPEELETITDKYAFSYSRNNGLVTIYAQGALLADLLSNLDTEVADNLIIQYLEADGYHAQAEDYQDQVAWLKNDHDSYPAMRTVITTEISDSYDGIYKDADDNSGYLRAYRDRGDANSTVLKHLLGVAISPEGNLADGRTGFTLSAQDTEGQKLNLADSVISEVTGLVSGMKYLVKVPPVIGASLADEAEKIFTAGETGSISEVIFSYQEVPYFYVKNGTQITEHLLSDLKQQAQQIPEASAELPYGYQYPDLVRYQGVWLADLLPELNPNQSLNLIQADGTQIALNSSGYFLAYQQTQSRDQDRTAENKRTSQNYELACLLNPASGISVSESQYQQTGEAGQKPELISEQVVGLEIVDETANSYAITTDDLGEGVWNFNFISGVENGQAKAGETVEVQLNRANKAYMTSLSGLQVITSSGIVVEVQANLDTTANYGNFKSGTFSFTMPDEAVSLAPICQYNDLQVYLQVGSSGTPSLIHSYSRAELAELAPEQTYYYTGYDSKPEAVVGKSDQAVPLTDLIANASQIYGQELSNFSQIQFTSIDSYTNNFSYDYLCGSPRYYYPNLASGSSSGQQEVGVLLTLKAIQDNFSNLSSGIEDQKTDTLNSYRLVFGQTATEFNNGVPDTSYKTTGNYAKWVQKITLVMPSDFEAQELYNLSGTVTNASQQTLAGIQVQLYQNGNLLNSAQTDEQGHYNLAGTMLSGNCYLVISGTNYQSLTTEAFSLATNLIKNVQLERSSSGGGSSGGQASYEISLSDEIDGIWTVDTAEKAEAGQEVTVTVNRAEKAYQSKLQGISVSNGLNLKTISKTDTEGTFQFTMPEKAVQIEVLASYTSLEFYLKQGNQDEVLITSWGRSAMESMAEDYALYYSAYDSMPEAVLGKTDLFVPLATLLENAAANNSAVEFGQGCTLYLSATDNPDYEVEYTYDYLYGENRYSYPELDRRSDDDSKLLEPVLALKSYQSRSSNLDGSIEDQKTDTLNAYRFIFGQTENDFSKWVTTSNLLTKWVDKIVLYQPEDFKPNKSGGSSSSSSSTSSDGTVKPTEVPATEAITPTDPTLPADLETEAPTAPVFKDVQPEDWYYSAVNYVASQGILKGITADLFAPQQNLSRAMTVTALYNLEKETKVYSSGNFQDVPANAWYSQPIAWATDQGIVKGVSANLFAPDKAITREELVVILYNYASYKKWNLLTNGDVDRFKDAGSVSAWAEKPLRWALGQGYFSGRTNDLLAPKATSTRAEFASVLQRLLTAK